MVLEVLRPRNVDMLCGGPVRSSRCCRHQVSGHGSSTLSPVRRRLALNPWGEWRTLRKLQQSGHSQVLQQLASLRPDLCPVELRLDSMIEGFNRVMAFDKPSVVAANSGASLYASVPGVMKWTECNEETREVCGQLQLPANLRSSDEVQVDLTEATRTLTVRVVRSSKNHDQQAVSKWELSHILDESMDLAELEAALDPHNCILNFRAPLKGCQASKQGQHSTHNSYIGASAQRPKLANSVPISRRPVEIEDIGPDEESDKVSVLSSDEDSHSSVNYV